MYEILQKEDIKTLIANQKKKKNNNLHTAVSISNVACNSFQLAGPLKQASAKIGTFPSTIMFPIYYLCHNTNFHKPNVHCLAVCKQKLLSPSSFEEGEYFQSSVKIHIHCLHKESRASSLVKLPFFFVIQPAVKQNHSESPGKNMIFTAGLEPF